MLESFQRVGQVAGNVADWAMTSIFGRPSQDWAEQQRHRQAFQRLFATPDGQVVLGYLVNRYKVFSPLDDGNDRQLVADEAQRRLVLALLMLAGVDKNRVTNLGFLDMKAEELEQIQAQTSSAAPGQN